MAGWIMTPHDAAALGLDVRPDGKDAMVILRNGAAFAWIERSRRDRHLWRGVMAGGDLYHARTVSELLDVLAANAPPR
jgi:hypothetical protein